MFMTVVVLMNLDDNAKVDEDCEDDDAQDEEEEDIGGDDDDDDDDDAEDEEEAIGAPWPAPLTNPSRGSLPATF